MSEQFFIKVLNMSLTGSFVILAILVMRLFLRRVPRIFSYCLWGVVLFRLLCPVSFTAGFSLLGALEQSAISQGRMVYIPEELAQAGRQEGQFGEAVGISLGADAGSGEGAGMEENGTAAGVWERIFLPGKGENVVLWAGTRIWLLGLCVMAGYSFLTLAGLKRKLQGARQEGAALYVTKEMSTPFVIGLLRPRIYLPEGLGEREKAYVLLHEQIHIRRGDHVVKILAFLALCIHWFNPLAWVAFFLSEKDMEMSCDEAVIRRIGSNVKKEYTASLLGMATGRHVVSGVPLAFGEGDTGSRIRNVLRYRKPAAMAVMVAAVCCVVVAMVLLANPAKVREEKEQAVYYGVVSEIQMEGSPNNQRVLQIPGWDMADIPEADSISVYFEREEQELLPGDVVQVTFPAGEEVTVLETWPMRFAQKAESIVVLWSGCMLERLEGGTYGVSFAAGVVPGYETAAPGDILSIYWEKGDPEAPAYLSWVPEGEDSVLVAQAPLLAVGESPDGIRMFTVELTVEQVQRLFEGFGFHIRFALEQSIPDGQEDLADETGTGREGAGGAETPGVGGGTGKADGTGTRGDGTGNTDAGNTGAGSTVTGSMGESGTGRGSSGSYVVDLEGSPPFWKGNCVRSPDLPLHLTS